MKPQSENFIHKLNPFHITFVWLLTLATVFTSTQAKPLSLVAPESVGVSSSRLNRIDQTIQRNIDANRLVGAVTMVSRNGRVVHFKAHDLSDAEDGMPMKVDAIFRIYSMTKPITTAAAMILHEEGHFQFGDPVHYYLPELKDLKVFLDNGTVQGGREKLNKPVTIANLMSHTSGFTYGILATTRLIDW